MRLKRADVSSPGIRRIPRGRGFWYVDASGQRVTDRQTLSRIDGLVIPPAWTDVWICPYPNGHIQATGTDAAGRRQYRYHDAWRAAQDRKKHERMLEFAQRLPKARERMCRDLATTGLGRRRVLAAAARLLDLGFFRIGGEEYAETNGSFGLATLRKSHVSIESDGSVLFDYKAKSGKQRRLSIAEPELCEIVTALKLRRGGGRDLLAWKDESGWHDVRSSDINAYVAELLGDDYTAKDFRTWHATVLCAVSLAVAREVPATESARKRAISWAVKDTAHHLGNTPSVCRSSYIDPRVIDAFTDGITIYPVLDRLGAASAEGELATQGPIEKAVLNLLRKPEARHQRRAA